MLDFDPLLPITSHVYLSETNDSHGHPDFDFFSLSISLVDHLYNRLFCVEGLDFSIQGFDLNT